MTVMVISRALNSSPSTSSALETLNPQYPGSPAFLAETEETPAKQKETVTLSNQQMKEICKLNTPLIAQPKYRSNNQKSTIKNLGQYSYSDSPVPVLSHRYQIK